MDALFVKLEEMIQAENMPAKDKTLALTGLAILATFMENHKRIADALEAIEVIAEKIQAKI